MHASTTRPQSVRSSRPSPAPLVLLALLTSIVGSSCADAGPEDTYVRCECATFEEACSCTEGDRVVALATLRLDPGASPSASEAFVTVAAPAGTLGLAFEVVARGGAVAPAALSFDLLDEERVILGHDGLVDGAVRLGPLPASGWLRIGNLQGWVDAGGPVDVVVSAVVPADDAFFANESWMDSLDAAIESTALNALCMIGTHDSATSGINPDSDWGTSWPDGQRFLPATTAIRTSRAQDQSIALQLLFGARYFDLRVDVVEPGVMRVYHGLLGEHLDGILDELRAFSDAHPRELLILDLQHIVGGPGVPDPKGAVVARVFERLGDLAADPGALTPLSPVGDFWVAGTPLIIIVPGASAADRMNYPIWDRAESLSDSWPNQQDLAGLSASLDLIVAGRTADKIFSLQGVMTPDDEMAFDWALDPSVATVETSCPDDTAEVGLCSLARLTNPALLERMSGAWASDSLNVIKVDYPEVAPLVEACIARNSAP